MSKTLDGRGNWRRRSKKAREANGDFCRKLDPCPQRAKVLKTVKGDSMKRYVMCKLNGLCSQQTAYPQQVLVRSSRDYVRFVGGPLDE